MFKAAIAVRETEQEIADVVVSLLNLTVTTILGGVQCQMCGERNDEHSVLCPIPALEAWLALQ